ncbi:MAG: ATP-binding cassette domain-containing protein [Sedimentisphaerales bacterium]|nr:ATP-binding cassette domain-containing protein [Sedimentisphaerales bacterium]
MLYERQSVVTAVHLSNVSKYFGEVQAVCDLSVSVSAGSIYGFLGPNGAGKTTTLRMIMNIIRPDTGRIEVLGDGSIEKVKTRIGYMPEERGLYRKMTATGVLSYFAVIKGLPKTEAARRVPQWLERVGLTDRAGKKVEELSRGMHQKLQFAVTAINEPDLLILDEPFSGLDPINTDLLKTIILDMRDKGKTVIFSTHVMHEAEKLCDSILLINKGKIVLDDKLAAVKARDKSRTVVLEAEGDTNFIRHLPIVTAVESEANYLEVTLTEDADPQELLREIVNRIRVRRFEVKVPSLHEIFVNLIGSSNAQDS